MLEFIFWLTGPIALTMCMIIFKRLKKIETRISTFAPSANETPLAKPQPTKYAPLPLAPSKTVTVNPNAQQRPAQKKKNFFGNLAPTAIMNEEE